MGYNHENILLVVAAALLSARVKQESAALSAPFGPGQTSKTPDSILELG